VALDKINHFGMKPNNGGIPARDRRLIKIIFITTFSVKIKLFLFLLITDRIKIEINE
jgi:hypothetical protein